MRFGSKQQMADRNKYLKRDFWDFTSERLYRQKFFYKIRFFEKMQFLLDLLEPKSHFPKGGLQRDLPRSSKSLIGTNSWNEISEILLLRDFTGNNFFLQNFTSERFYRQKVFLQNSIFWKKMPFLLGKKHHFPKGEFQRDLAQSSIWLIGTNSWNEISEIFASKRFYRQKPFLQN